MDRQTYWKPISWTGFGLGPLIYYGSKMWEGYQLSSTILGLPPWAWEAIGGAVFFLAVAGLLTGYQNDTAAKALSGVAKDESQSLFKIEFDDYRDFEQKDVAGKTLPMNQARHRMYWMWITAVKDIRNVSIELESITIHQDRPTDIYPPGPDQCGARLHFETGNYTRMSLSNNERAKVFTIERTKDFPDTDPIHVVGTNATFPHRQRFLDLNMKITGEGINQETFTLSTWVDDEGNLRMVGPNYIRS